MDAKSAAKMTRRYKGRPSAKLLEKARALINVAEEISPLPAQMTTKPSQSCIGPNRS
jgi:hypothetical protein